MIVSPLNYPGNKTKVVKEIFDTVAVENDTFVDVFCGSATVAINSPSSTLVCNDADSHAIDLLQYFYKTSGKSIVEDVYDCIKKYGLTDSASMPRGTYVENKHEGLSKYNKEGFQKLKADYNNNNDARLLFVLIIYGFNHYLRFNRKGEYNVPVGKNDFYKILQERTVSFADEIKKKKVCFLNYDFRNPKLYEDNNAFYYFDPPYLITNAPYNSFWDENDERDLLGILEELDKRNAKFALSNVIESNGKVNKILLEWVQKNSFTTHVLKRQYRNANYRRKNITLAKEVLIANF